MANERAEPNKDTESVGVNPGYAAFQIAKALATSRDHDDASTRERASRKAAKWETVLENILSGSAQYGSRAPIKGVPGWATLEVVTGGFATGDLLAGGPLQKHELDFLQDLPEDRRALERAAINAYFLTESGVAELRSRLQTGRYTISVPEEGALLVVSWLADRGHHEKAQALLDELAPFFQTLRFYPVPREQPTRFGSRVHLQDVAKTIEDLRGVRPNEKILAQKEAVEVWAPFHDRVVGLFLETYADGWPCRTHPSDWAKRAEALLAEFTSLRNVHRRCGKPGRRGGHQAQLRNLLARYLTNPDAMTSLEVGRVRLICGRYMSKRGAPESQQCQDARRRQRADVAAPMFHDIVSAVLPRFEKHVLDDGVDAVDHLQAPITKEESVASGVREDTRVPESIQAKIQRCLNETVDVLVERGLVTSGETLARVLPQMTSGLRAAGISDPTLRQLYAAIYRAFRQRRSLLLLNLEKQVQIEELPWINAIDQFRNENLSSRELARQTLEEVSLLGISSFPHVILPNKLSQELRALSKGANLDLPLVDEVAADIFMGRFSGKFLEAARRAGALLSGTLYAAYYDIDYDKVGNLPESHSSSRRGWFRRASKVTQNSFAEFCAARAGVSLGTWDPATNGMIIEQQQILTTQNLATLFSGLGLAESLDGQLLGMAERCFRWICRRHQMKIARWHAQLIMVKNTAYAWRQMIFFLSLLPASDVSQFLTWAEKHLAEQGRDFQDRFRPALAGLAAAAGGRPLGNGARRFLGWSKEKHWLLLERDAQR